MVTRVILIRHGLSSYNAQKKIQGRCNESILTDKGQEDAKIVGETLQGIPISAIYCSPLQRAKSTADIIHNCLTNPPAVTPVDTLLEIDLPLWENIEKTDIQEKYPQEYDQWKTNPHQFKMRLETADGTFDHYPVLALYEQAKQFWRETLEKHQGETIVIVAHNGINRCLIMSAIGIDPARYHTIQQSNCCINILNFTGNYGDPVQVESLNQIAHLGTPLPSYRPNHQGIRLLLVRHGETEWNRSGRFQGIRDIPLNDNGRLQASKAGDFLKDIPIDFAITSPMLRPKETAEIILKHHPDVKLEEDERLKEICHGLWEGKFESEIEQDFPGLLQQWKEKPETVQMPEGENLQQVWERAVVAWNELVQSHTHRADCNIGLVVAHDAINKALLCYLLGLKPDNFWNIKQGNGAVTVIDYPNGLDDLPVLQAINITSHISGGVLDKTAAGAL